MSTWNDFGVILQHFGVILGYFGFTLSSLWRKLAEVGAKLCLSWPNLAPSSDPVEPKSGNVEKVLVFKSIFEGFYGPKYPPRLFRRPCRRGPGSRYSRFRTSNISETDRTRSTRACGLKGRGPISPFGVRAAALVRDNVLKVEYPEKLNFRLISLSGHPFP